MDRIKRARKMSRRKFTSLENELKADMAKDVPDMDVIKSKYERLQEVLGEICDFDEKLLNAMLDANLSDQELESERDGCDQYRDRWSVINVSVRGLLYPVEIHRSPVRSVMSAESVESKKQYKLPKIELRKFGGELKEWLGWWSLFEKIHEDAELHDSVKFQYLLQSMAPGSRARDVVEGYPQTAENYPKAIRALKERFGRDNLLVEVYVRELLKLAMDNLYNKEKVPLAKMFDRIESHLRALESLGVTSDKCAAMLYPIVESSLSEELLRAWQRSAYATKDGSNEHPTKTTLDYLLDFLRQEVQNEERIALAKNGLGIKGKKNKYGCNEGAEEQSTAAGLYAGQSEECLFCDKVGHQPWECFRGKKMTLDERRDALKQKKGCFLCMKSGHISSKCKSNFKCKSCNKRHATMMCNNQQKKLQEEVIAKGEEAAASMSSLTCMKNVLLQTILVYVLYQGHSRVARLIFDTGSQRSYVRKDTAAAMGLRSVGEEWIRKSLFGGTVTKCKKVKKYQLSIQGLDGKNTVQIEVLEEVDICGSIPKVPQGTWLRELLEQGIVLSDVDSSHEVVEILVGSDHYGELMTGKSIHAKCGLTAFETKLGWTLCGKVPIIEESSAMIATSLLVSNLDVSQLWSMEAIGIYDPVQSLRKDEKEAAAKIYFQKTVSQGKDGRYFVSLPWIDEKPRIPDNKIIAEKRLTGVTEKLRKQGMYDSYQNVFESWQQEGIIEVVEESENPQEENSCHYLPHHAVIKPESLTTPVRPVFDASCKSKRSPSLNECLEKGQNLIELIPSIVLRFRKGKIGVISDIRKAFLQISVNKCDRDFLRFLWWEDYAAKKLKIFRHKRVVFGLNCSPFLLGAVIEHHLEKYRTEFGEIVKQLMRSFYVDNCVTAVDSPQELENFVKVAVKIFADAKMDLRQWEWNSVVATGVDSSTSGECELAEDSISILLKDKQVTSVLGLKWDKQRDMLGYDISAISKPEKMSKRIILSVVQRVFDPMGYLCPAMIGPKLLLQEAWADKSSWDEELRPELRQKFESWIEELPKLKNVFIKRYMFDPLPNSVKSIQLHTFCDASKVAYAAAVFIRAEDKDGNVTLSLLQAKSRVAPLKTCTVPRLELLGCNIGARLLKSVKEALSFEDVPTFLWSDSSTALAWIKRNDLWGTFVGNRVREICKISKPEEWRHVPGKMNPADLPSRGCSPEQLLELKWWEGPDWLRLSEDQWPQSVGEINEEEILMEKKKGASVSLTVVHAETSWYCERSSSFIKNIKIMGWILRFVDKTRKKVEVSSTKSLSTKEIDNAENKLVKIVQKEVFPAKKSVISGLVVDEDGEGILRVKTRLLYREDTEGFRMPILLPHVHPIVNQLIRQVHLENGHAGVQFVLGKLRENFWIIQGRKAVRSIVSRCVRCRRFAARCPEVAPSALPENRVRTAKVFQVIGVDVAGPLFLKNKSKVYIVIFTCAVYRGIHLELVTSLSTEAFLWAFQRFVDRRGRPEMVYSDNGRNFLGTANLLEAIDWDLVEEKAVGKKIGWRFNPPTAAWWGGWWERLIRTVKDLMKRILGNSKLDFEELLTCLVHVEGVVNGRPLTCVSEDPDDLIPLTPSMFMQDLADVRMPEDDLTTGPGLSNRFKHLMRVRESLRSRFRKEYLSQLVQKGKTKVTELKVGDVVLVGSDDKKRQQWPMAIVTEVLPGRDGKVRTVRVKTSKGTIIRPVQRIYPLEVSSKSDVTSLCCGIAKHDRTQ